MNNFLVDLTEVKVNPFIGGDNYKVGDVYNIIIEHPILGEIEINKKVVKITFNEFNNQRFIFVENFEYGSFNGVHNDYDEMVEQEIARLMDNPNA
jgi:hypothetical protein